MYDDTAGFVGNLIDAVAQMRNTDNPNEVASAHSNASHALRDIAMQRYNTLMVDSDREISNELHERKVEAQGGM